MSQSVDDGMPTTGTYLGNGDRTKDSVRRPTVCQNRFICLGVPVFNLDSMLHKIKLEKNLPQPTHNLKTSPISNPTNMTSSIQLIIRRHHLMSHRRLRLPIPCTSRSHRSLLHMQRLDTTESMPRHLGWKRRHRNGRNRDRRCGRIARMS